MDNIYKIEDLDSYLRRFCCYEALIEIGKISQEIFNTNYSHKKFYFDKDKTIYSIVSQWGLAFIAYRLIMASNDSRKEKTGLNEIIEAHKIYVRLPDPFLKDKNLQTFFIRTSQEQFGWQEMKPELIFCRYKEIFNKNIKFGKWFKDFFGITINEFMLIGFSIFARQHHENNPFFSKASISNCSIESMAKNILIEDKIDIFLKYASSDYWGIRDLDRTINKISIIGYDKYNFNPLLQYPIIKGDSRFQYFTYFQYIIPNKFLLLYKISIGIYWLLRNKFQEEESNEFLTIFGEAFEEYIGDILRLYFSSKSIFKVKDFLAISNDSMPTHADWVILNGNEIYLFECKSSLLPLKCKKISNEKDIEDWCKDNLLKGSEQLLKTEESIKKNKPQFKKITKFIITLDNLFIAESPAIKSFLIKEYAQKGIYIISATELESMELWVKRYGFNRIIMNKEKIDKRNDVTEKNDFISACRKIDSSIKAKSEYLGEKFKGFMTKNVPEMEQKIITK